MLEKGWILQEKRAGERSKMGMRIMSRASSGMVYHRPECRYAGKIQKIRDQRFILFHRNYVNGRIDLKDVEKAPFHRQGDMPEAGSIMRYLKYIKNHDEFKHNTPEDYRKMPQDTERQKAYYRAAKKRVERRNAKRLDSLFLLIEKQEGIKQC